MLLNKNNQLIDYIMIYFWISFPRAEARGKSARGKSARGKSARGKSGSQLQNIF